MKFGLSAFVSHLGLQPEDLARHAETAGFESFFVSEHTHIPVSTDFPIADEVPLIYKSMYDPFVALAAAAAVTTDIRLGTAICILPQHDVVNCAKAVATLAHISKGRVTLGVGAGWNPPEMEHHGIAFSDRFAVTRESLEAMRCLWQDEVAEYHGDHINFEPSWAWPKPVQSPQPEVLLAGAGPNILKRVVNLADGWMPVFAMQWHDSMAGKQTPLETLAQDQAMLRELEAKKGKPKTTISAMGLPPTAEYIDYLMGHGIERMILSVPNEEPKIAEDVLGQYAEAIASYR